MEPLRESVVFSAWLTFIILNFIETEGALEAFEEKLSRIFIAWGSFWPYTPVVERQKEKEKKKCCFHVEWFTQDDSKSVPKL